MRCAALLAVVALGCGRIGFDGGAAGRDGDPGGDATDATDANPSVDAAPRTSSCLHAATALDPIHLVGRTIRYTDFVGNYVPLDNVMIAATEQGVPIGAVTSNAQGDFDLALTTNGAPIQPILSISRTGYATTLQEIDTPITYSYPSLLFAVATAGGIDAAYSLISLTRMTSRGTISVAALDCTGVGVPGVVFAVTPAPGAIGYFRANGTIGALATTGPFFNAVVYNAVPGTNRITASLAGEVFLDQDVEVVAGNNQTVAIMRLME